MSPFLVHWIENSLRHRTVQAELNGEKIKREVVKGNSQGGILSPFLWNCVLNSWLVDLRNRGFHVQAYADDVAILVTGTNMLWIERRAQKALNIASNLSWNEDRTYRDIIASRPRRDIIASRPRRDFKVTRLETRHETS